MNTETTVSNKDMTEIVGVRFRDAGKVYYFAPNGIKVRSGDCVIVETARGMEFGFAASSNSHVPTSKIVPPLRPVLRVATEEDRAHYEDNKRLEAATFEIWNKKTAEHNLDMKLVEAEYTFDNSKLLFYFASENRVDFRDLVKDLASVFRTRIELRQIGIRDEAKMLGGLGVCGRPFCCASFLSDFVQVSIKMAKEQNLSLNSSKISGTCGRLMCCLRYEHETYEEEIARTPPVDSTVKTADGVGTPTRAADGDDLLAVINGACIQRHQGDLHAHLGALTEHPQGVGHDLHRVHAGELFAEAPLGARQGVGSGDHGDAGLPELLHFGGIQNVFALFTGTEAVGDGHHLAGIAQLFGQLQGHGDGAAAGGGQHHIQFQIPGGGEGQLQGLFGIVNAGFVKQQHMHRSFAFFTSIPNFGGGGNQ